MRLIDTFIKHLQSARHWTKNFTYIKRDNAYKIPSLVLEQIIVTSDPWILILIYGTPWRKCFQIFREHTGAIIVELIQEF